jgi:hypothetical protein
MGLTKLVSPGSCGTLGFVFICGVTSMGNARICFIFTAVLRQIAIVVRVAAAQA